MQKLGGVSFHWERGWLLIHLMVMLISVALEYIPELMFLMGYLLYRLPVCRFSEQSSHRSPGLFDLCVFLVVFNGTFCSYKFWLSKCYVLCTENIRFPIDFGD